MSDAEAEVREPLLKFLRQHYVNVPADARASELKKLAMPFGRGDPLVERWLRKIEDEEQHARETRQRAPTLPRDTNIVSHQELHAEIEATRQLAVELDEVRQKVITAAITKSVVEPYGRRFLKVEDKIIALERSRANRRSQSETRSARRRA